MSWRLDPQKTGLLIIDLQEKLVPVVHDSARIVEQAKRLIQFGQLLQIPIYVTEQAPDKLGPTVSELRTLVNWPIALAKTSFSALPVLPKNLPKSLIVAGVETHVCIRQTVYDLRRQDRTVYLMGDAISSRRQLDHKLALQEMRADGVLVSSVEAFAFEVLGSSEHPLFRAALNLFK